MYRMPTFESPMNRKIFQSVPGIVASPPNGITANAAIAQKSETNGAARNSRSRAPDGIACCFCASLPRSAIGCSRPTGPTRFGP